MRRVLLILPVVFFAILVVVLAFLMLERGRDPSFIPSPLVGKPVPQFALPAVAADIVGGFATEDLRGRVSMVNVFASWCLPCLVEHPLLSRLAADGIPIYGINHRDTAPDAVAWLKKNGNPFTAVGFDPDGRAAVAQVADPVAIAVGRQAGAAIRVTGGRRGHCGWVRDGGPSR